MHPFPKSLGSLVITSALAVGTAAAQLETKLHAGYSSEYLWRGLDLGHDLVEAGLDVSTTYHDIGLSAGAWYGCFETGGQHHDELDLYGEVARDFGWIKGSIGYIAYLYPDANSNAAQEVYFGVARDLGFATASLKYFWSVAGANNDGYAELGLSKSFELNPDLNLTVDSNLGYLVEQGQATAWTTRLTLDWGFAPHAKLSPFIALSLALSDDANTAYLHSNNEFAAGTLLSFSF